jgi:thimet oligopeptidase
VPYDQAVELLDTASNQCQLIQAVHPDTAVRSRAGSLVQKVGGAITALSLNEKVYKALEAIDLSNSDGPTRYYIERTLLRFKLAGVGRDPGARAHIRALNDDITRLSAEFHRNLQEDVRKVRISSVTALDGLPPDFIARHKPSADGSITLTTEMPDVSPVLQFANNGVLRQSVYVAYNNRGYPKNISVLSDLLHKRQELAKLSGYRSWAEMAAADKMAGSPEKVREFLNQLDAASRSSARREFDLMLKVARKRDPRATTISVADVDYWSGQVARQFGFDPESVRPYFPYERVQQGILEMASRLFHISFQLVPGADVWDTSVATFDVFDADRRLGRIYLDMHPRSGKDQWYSAATVLDGGQGELPEAALICNFGGGTADDPGLMGGGGISTFLHEFGHLLHALFQGQQQWSGFANNTESDFTEAPSQMLENFLESSAMLTSFAKHYRTNEPIPPALVRRMIQTSSFRRILSVD